MREGGQHLFPGTVARFVIKSYSIPGQVEISFIWRSSVMPSEMVRKQQLEAFQQALIDVLDWSTARYDNGEVLMHT